MCVCIIGLHSCIRTYIHTYKHTLHTYMHTHIHTHVRTHTSLIHVYTSFQCSP